MASPSVPKTVALRLWLFLKAEFVRTGSISALDGENLGSNGTHGCILARHLGKSVLEKRDSGGTLNMQRLSLLPVNQVNFGSTNVLEGLRSRLIRHLTVRFKS